MAFAHHRTLLDVPGAPPERAPSPTAERAAAALMAFPAGVQASAVAGFALGRALSAWDLLAGLVASALVSAGGARRRGAATLLGCLAVLAAATAAAPLRYDTSYDGQSYHQQAVIALARGWNPVRSARAPATFETAPFVTHMAKGAWVVEAAVYRLTHRLETGKMLHLVLATAALLAVWAALRATPGLPPMAAAAAALLAAVTPVVAVQAFTFYVDGLVASSFTVLLALGALVAARGATWPRRAGMAAATLVLVNAKLTGVPYAALLWLAAALAAGALRGGRAGLHVATAGAVALVAALLVGYSPYVTNTVLEGHPFHPAAGPRSHDLVRDSRPPSFARMGRAERLARSLLAVSSPDASRDAQLKVPFTIVGDEATKFHAPDVRLGGFGPLFSGALLAAAGAVLLASRRTAVRAVAVSVALLATVLVTAEGWWARFAPQLWLLPLALALAPLACPRRRAARWAGTLVLVVLAADAGLVIANNASRNRGLQREVRQQLARLAAAPEPVPVWLGFNEAASVRLDEAGVRWRAVARLPCAAPEPLAGTVSAQVCPPAPRR